MSIQRTLQALGDDVYKTAGDGHGIASDDVDFHLLGVIALLSTRGDLLGRVIPLNQPADGRPLYELGIDPARVSPASLEGLRPFREGFASVQRAWAVLAGYENPPCPPNGTSRDLVVATSELKGRP